MSEEAAKNVMERYGPILLPTHVTPITRDTCDHIPHEALSDVLDEKAKPESLLPWEPHYRSCEKCQGNIRAFGAGIIIGYHKPVDRSPTSHLKGG